MTRRAHDFYPTPSWATRELLNRVDINGTVLEPCVGAGDMTRELAAVGQLRTNDLDVTHQADSHEDATNKRWWNTLPQYDWVITNPPFNVAHKILPHACEHATKGVAMLLRLTYLEPCEGRDMWLSVNPPHRLIVLPRISFTGDGKADSVTCAWFVWEWFNDRRGVEIVMPRQATQELFGEAANA